jgi:hypothetical protein
MAPWLLEKAWPHVTVNMDKRDYLYTNEALWRVVMALKRPHVMAEQLRRYNPDFFTSHRI